MEIKTKIIEQWVYVRKCNECGFEEKRLTDGKVPLVLDFEDGDRKNHKYENLRMLCFNCSFLINGNLTEQEKNTSINELYYW